MKNKILIIFSFIVIFSIISCKKSYLDEQPTQLLSSDQIAAAAKTDPSLLNGNIAGLYTAIYSPGLGSPDANRHDDDLGQKGTDIFTDMLCSDMVLGALNYGWYSGIVRYQNTVDFTSSQSYIPWRYYYRIIFAANTLIDALGGTDVVPVSADQKYLMGQAKAIRGYAYFYLAQLYSKNGFGTGSEKVLPIYITAASANQALSTNADVYKLIISDLTTAVSYLQGFNRTSKDQINQTVAKGLLAYAYAARGTSADLQQVVTLTNDIISSGAYRLETPAEVSAQLDPNTGALLNPQSGFNDVNNPSWMWGVDLTLANKLGLISWWGQMDVFTYSYAWAGDPKLIDKSLFDAIRPDDVRKNQFDSKLRPTGKFFSSLRKIGGQRSIVTDYVYMRLEEMYLLNAEANAKLGQDLPAKITLKALLDNRINDDSYIATLGGQALKDEIYLQTRIELWGEGKSYLAMKRDKATITRGSNHLFFAGQSFSYDDEKLTFKIPQAEILANPLINP